MDFTMKKNSSDKNHAFFSGLLTDPQQNSPLREMMPHQLSLDLKSSA
jgi:hypothetical protein